jgi:hypothetical protein
MFSARIPFSPAISPDPYWTNVVFLENFESPATAFKDGSNNNAPITVIGQTTTNPRTNYNTPFTGIGGSLYNTSLTTYLTLPTNTAYSFATGDFTVECWIYPTNTVSSSTFIGVWTATASTSAWVLSRGATNASAIRFAFSDGTTITSVESGSGVITLNAWQHVTVVRSSGTLRMYVNGVQRYSAANSATIANPSTVLALMTSSSGVSATTTTGFVSNVRIVKGVGVYTSAFTPSTQPLPATQSANIYGNPSSAITGTQTSMLMNFTDLGMQNNNTFFDMSNTAAIPTITSMSYSGATPLSKAYPGSAYFNSAGRISFPNNSGYLFGSGDFTVELWYYHQPIPGANIGSRQIIGCWDGPTNSSRSWSIQIDGAGGGLRFYMVNTSLSQSNYSAPNTGMVANTWYHIAVVRSSGTLRMYLNGVEKYSAANSVNIANSASLLYMASVPSVGASYIAMAASDVRIVKGVGVYTSAFIPSNLPLPSIQSANVYGNPSAAIASGQTTFLLSGQCAGFYDLSLSGQLISNPIPTATVKTVSATQQFKFGAQSNTLLPTSYQSVTSRLNTGSLMGSIQNNSLQLQTGDFTIEGWVYTNAAGVVYGIINKGASTPTGWSLEINTSNQLIWYSAGTAVKTSTDTIPASTWTYFAISRSGTNLYMFINGTLQGTAGTDSANYTQTNNMIIGATRALGNGLNGYLDDLRITKGIARYTASFAAPTTSFPTS